MAMFYVGTVSTETAIQAESVGTGLAGLSDNDLVCRA